MGELNKSDIKLMEPQNLDDTDEGGGAMTTREVVDGSVNNLFPDISRLDRTYGRVSLRKAFLSVQTDNQNVYYGSHIALTEQAADPLVSVTFFTTKDWFDQRVNAVDKIQSYLAVGPQFMGALYGNHYQGSRLMRLYAELTTEAPKVNEVIALTTDENTYEYVRVKSIEIEIIEGLDVYNRNYKKQVFTIETGSALSQDYQGEEIRAASVYTTIQTIVATTIVADASNYYGTAKLAEPITAGDLSLKVDSIFANIVPSAQSSSSTTDFGVGVLTSTVVKLDEFGNISRSVSWTITSNAILSVGEPFEAGSLTYGSFYDDGKGVFRNSVGDAIGSIDYVVGDIVIKAGVTTTNYSDVLDYVPCCVQEQISIMGSIPVTLLNRGYAYVFNCNPVPAMGSLRIDYRSGGKWYSLFDNGSGEIVHPMDASLGSASLNRETGTISMSLGYLPDVDSNIFLFWGEATAILWLPHDDIPTRFEYQGPEENKLMAPGTLSITWEQGMGGSTVTKTISDVAGQLMQDGEVVGEVHYANKTLSFEPYNCTPIPQTIFDISYQTGDQLVIDCDVTGINPATLVDSSGSVTNVLPNTIRIKMRLKSDPINLYSAQIINCYTAGDLVGSVKKEIDGDECTFYIDCVAIDDGSGNMVWAGDRDIIIGTIDYATFQITLNFNGHVAYRLKITTPDGSANPIPVTFQAPLGLYEDSLPVYYRTESTFDAVNESVTLPRVYEIDSGNTIPLVPGSNRFRMESTALLDDNKGKIVDYNSTEWGSIDYSAKTVTITKTDSYSDSENLELEHVIGAISVNQQIVSKICFRTPAAPVVPSMLTFRVVAIDGSVISATANFEGDIIATGVEGGIDYEYGVVVLKFGRWVPNDAAAQAEPWYSLDEVSDDNTQVWQPLMVFPDTALISCVSTSYIPLDPELLGLNPVRLPIDGRVPIFKDGGIILIHHSLQHTCPAVLTPGQVINVGRTGLSMIELYDSDGVYVPETNNYMVDLENGLVTMNDPLDLSVYNQPLIALHRIEDMILASDAQVTGHIACTRMITNDYPVEDTMVSSVLPCGDLQARAYNIFTQQSWPGDGEWSNSRIGDDILAKYDVVNYPIEVVNSNATRERWALIIDGNTTIQIGPDTVTVPTVQVVGEHLGILASDVPIANDIEVGPSGNPYFIIRYEGWGSGWSVGNVLRFNTDAANYPLWFCRATMQGPATESSDNYVIAIRGDSS